MSTQHSLARNLFPAKIAISLRQVTHKTLPSLHSPSLHTYIHCGKRTTRTLHGEYADQSSRIPQLCLQLQTVLASLLSRPHTRPPCLRCPFLRFCTKCGLGSRPALEHKYKLGGSLRHVLSQNWLLNFAPCRRRWTCESLTCCPRSTSWPHNLWKEEFRPGSQTYSAQHLRRSSVVLYRRGSLRDRARGSACGCGRQHDDGHTFLFSRLQILSVQ